MTLIFKTAQVEAHLVTEWPAILVGLYACSMDSDGRITVPKPFRHKLHAHGFDQIGVFTDGNHVRAFPIRRQSDRKPDDWSFIGIVGDDTIAVVNVLQISKRGRITLPAALRQAAGFSAMVYVVGLGRCFELIDPATFEKRRLKLAEAEPQEPVACVKQLKLAPSGRAPRSLSARS